MCRSHASLFACLAIPMVASILPATHSAADECYSPRFEPSCCEVVFSGPTGHGTLCGTPPLQWSCPHDIDSDTGYMGYVRDESGFWTDWAWDSAPGVCTFTIASCGGGCCTCIYSFPPVFGYCRSKEADGIPCP